MKYFTCYWFLVQLAQMTHIKAEEIKICLFKLERCFCILLMITVVKSNGTSLVAAIFFYLSVKMFGNTRNLLKYFKIIFVSSWLKKDQMLSLISFTN